MGLCNDQNLLLLCEPLEKRNVESARTYYKKSIALRRNLAEQYPDKPMYLAKLNVTRVDLALILQDEAEAEAMFNEAVSSFETLVAENKAVGFRRDFARVLNIRAGFLVRIGKYDLAEQSRQRAIGFYEECLSESQMTRVIRPRMPVAACDC